MRTIHYCYAWLFLSYGSTSWARRQPYLSKVDRLGVPVLQKWCGFRGGGGSGGGAPMYELNPNYVPPPSLAQYSVTDGFSIGRRKNLLQLVEEYSKDLVRTNPALAIVSALCLAIFASWQFIPSALPLLQGHFATSRANVAAGRWSCLLLSAVSHIEPWHILFNLLALLSLGPAVQTELERHRRTTSLILPRAFRNKNGLLIWPLLIGSALSGSLSFLALGGSRGASGLGLSGVTMSLLAFYSEAFPESTLGIVLAGILPVRLPSYQIFQILLLWSIVGSVWATRSSQSVAHSAHLGGLLFGMVYYQQMIGFNSSKRRRWRFRLGQG